MTPSFKKVPYSQKKFLENFIEIVYLCIMEILEYIVVSLVMGIISYIIWDREDKGVINRGEEWD